MAVGFPTKANWAAGDVLTASALDDLAGTVNTVQYLKPWNTVLNSNFSVWQRGTSISLAASTAYTSGFCADRWQTQTGANQAITVQRVATSDTTNLPNIQYAMRYQRNAGQTGTGSLLILQNYETVNSIPLAGKPVTLSFYARAGANYSAASNLLNVYVTTGTGTDQNGWNSYTGSFDAISSTATLTATWQRFSFTATLPSTTTELGPRFAYTPTGTAGAADYYEITGIQLELGSVANTYQPNQATYESELAACERYCAKSYDQNVNPGTSNGNAPIAAYQALSAANNTPYGFIQFPVTMRTAPTITCYSTNGTSATASTISSGADLSSNSAVASNISATGAWVRNQNASAFTTTQGAMFHYLATAEL
jgi:hypothetical protein